MWNCVLRHKQHCVVPAGKGGDHFIWIIVQQSIIGPFQIRQTFATHMCINSLISAFLCIRSGHLSLFSDGAVLPKMPLWQQETDN